MHTICPRSFSFSASLFISFLPFLDWFQYFPFCLHSETVFKQLFNYSARWLCSFLILQISLQILILSSELGIILSPCFSPFRSLYTCFWLTWNSWFYLNWEILCSYLLTCVFFAIIPCFDSSITRFISFFFTLYLAFNSFIFLFPFPPVFPRLSFSSLLISLLRLVISLSILFFYHGSFFFPILPFFTPTSFATQMAAAEASLFVWVTSSVSICLITAFTFLVTSLNFLWSTFLKGRYSSVSFLIYSGSQLKSFAVIDIKNNSDINNNDINNSNHYHFYYYHLFYHYCYCRYYYSYYCYCYCHYYCYYYFEWAHCS